MAESIAALAASINKLADSKATNSSDNKVSVEQSTQEVVSSCSETMFKSIEKVASSEMLNIAAQQTDKLIVKDNKTLVTPKIKKEKEKEKQVKKCIKNNYSQYLESTGILVQNIGNIKEINPVLSDIAQKFADHYKNIKILLDALKASQSTRAAFTLSLKNETENVITSCTQIGKILHENAIL